ncbi:hypothetical protein CFC21_107483 [Triticum aestivum]|uniref:DUF569 domain-containing protein n=2 Tax=Triticum aestivum TaxID=4565 RepID=A0A9R1MG39_WHEAT|nr:uncharacterized protein LOC123170060 [Triticum aestivum]KAF7106770.1 hypothetical protein CFC21_107483 [Triticum aestivum]
MEQFRDGDHVRLRSREYGTYLHADEDGHGVSLHHRRASMNAAWVVHVYEPPEAPVPYLLLHSAAYGRYLAATNVEAPQGHHWRRVEQRGCDQPEVDLIPWLAIRTESGDEVYLDHFHGGCLRANRNTGVSVDVDDPDNPSPTTLWVVEPIPATRRMPRLPLPPPACLHPPFNHDEVLSREITYVWPNVEGALVNHNVFVFRGRSLYQLRHELAWRLEVDVSHLAMCLPTRYGRFSPLVVDLPRNQQALIVVVDFAGTPAHAALRYADVDAA